MPLERGIVVTYETERAGQPRSGGIMPAGSGGGNRIRATSGHLDEVVVSIGGRKDWLWRAVDQDGDILDEIVQARRSTKAPRRLLGDRRD